MAKKGDYKANAKPASVAKRAYNSKPEQKKRRAERNATRRELEKDGRVKKGDGKDIDHKNHNTGDKSSKNLRVMSKSANRAKNLGRGGRPKGS
jgi:hypothetical protein